MTVITVGRTRLALVLVASSSFLAGTVYGQCAFNGPAKSKGLKSSFVRAVAGCPSDIYPAPNSNTGAGTPSCAPPAALSPYKFGAEGECVLSFKARVETPCEDGSGYPCNDPVVKVKCQDILAPDDTPIDGAEASAWRFQLNVRITANTEDNGDMTVIDRPIEIAFPAGGSGALSLSGHISDGCIACTPGNGLVGGTRALPACSNVEILSAQILDPNLDTFAVLGSGTR